MRWAEPVLAVRDLRRSLEFYERVLGLEVVRDFGSHAALTGGLALQSLESWAELLDKTPEDLWPGGFGGEVYYEAENFDDFLTELSRHPETELVHPVSIAGASGWRGCTTRTAISLRWASLWLRWPAVFLTADSIRKVWPAGWKSHWRWSGRC